ncbi:MAG: 23S rRNA (uracil(1939)-C(5))-methyltransferase RlmD, partial [Acetatifactor sp.]|nr:23S rRNA (uracil(1939)-C(5))-methyltransferase RlmD [Acetatifactor sp.]
FTLFVKDAVVGDVVEARITKAKKQYAYARLEKVLTSSPFRIQPKCPYHRQCGGCQIQALSYDKQLEYKQQKVRNNLIRIGGFSSDEIDRVMEPIIGMEKPYRYRNKAQYPVGTDREGHVVTGFYAGRTHTIIPSTECYLGAEENKEILEILIAHMEKYHISAYNEETGKGQVRHILIRKGFTTGEIMVCVVINGGYGQKGKVPPKKTEYIPYQTELLSKLSAVNGMTSVSVSINTEKTNVIMGKEIHTIWGSPVIHDVIHVRDMLKEGYPCTGQELTFAISPLSFYQVNPVQTEKLYSLALEYAGLTGKEVLWDLYCGIGTISLFLASGARQVCGVEIIPQAIEDARANARRNGIENAMFYVGKAEEVLPAFYEGRLEEKQTSEFCQEQENHQDRGGDLRHPDVIVVDPPRKGCDETCLDTILRMQPDRIVYVSCDSATLARDLRILCDGGYEVKRARAVDQFGHTVHVETVVLLSKQK